MPFLDNQTVGKRLKNKREKTELSARKYAMKAKIDPSQYNKIEKGELPITEVILNKLISTYKLNKDEILYGTDIPNYVEPQQQLLNEPEPNFGADGQLSMKAIVNLTESNKMMAESQIILARSHEELVQMAKNATASGAKDTFEAVRAKLLALQEFVIEHSVKKQPFQSKEEARAALNITTGEILKRKE